ncbi:unnamed protein product [Heterobilharzia americana]|nr:unnamed protein product [Heterobilharzia americana]
MRVVWLPFGQLFQQFKVEVISGVPDNIHLTQPNFSHQMDRTSSLAPLDLLWAVSCSNPIDTTVGQGTTYSTVRDITMNRVVCKQLTNRSSNLVINSLLSK